MQKARERTGKVVAEFVRIRAARSRNIGSLTTSATSPCQRPSASTVDWQDSLQCGPEVGFRDVGRAEFIPLFTEWIEIRSTTKLPAGSREQQDEPVRMSGLRVVLITRRFWPLMEDIERTLARLATGLRRRGAEVTVLTCRGSADWPERVDYQGTPVFRLPHPHRERWRTLRYLLAVDRWLRQHHEAVGVACVSQLRSDAYAVLRAGQRIGVPVVLRAESAGPQGDCQWQQRARFDGRVRRRCQQAGVRVRPLGLSSLWRPDEGDCLH